MWNIRDALTSEPLKCKVNSTLASPNRVHGDRIRFWTTDDLHGEASFDDAEFADGGVQDEDTQGLGLIEIEALAVATLDEICYTYPDLSAKLGISWDNLR